MGRLDGFYCYDNKVWLLEDELTEHNAQVIDLAAGRETLVDAVVMLLCREGEMELRLNHHSVTLRPGCILFALPGMILDTRRIAAGTRCMTMILSEAFTSSLDLGTPYRSYLAIQRQPMQQLNPELEEAFVNMCGMVRGILCQPDHPNIDRVLRLLFEAYFYGIGPYLHRAEAARIATAPELHTEQFLRLVEANYRQHTTVDWYAEQMNLTPKRLSICVRQTSGRTAGGWIERHRLLAATRLLRSGRHSIKEIAAQLGFPNQSSFGTWFRRHTGQSPRHYSQP